MEMKRNKVKAALAAAVALLAAGCGGGGGDAPPPPPAYTRMVSFGDSLSDVGTYRLGSIEAQGGGQFTVNDYSATRPKAGTNWTEQLAHELALSAPCAARLAPTAGCTNWAQGGAKVKDDSAPIATGLFPPESVMKQVQSYLAVHGSFAPTDLVTVLAGGNDALEQLAALASTPPPTEAQVATAVQTAGANLVALVKTQLLANGAQRVVLVLLPDIGVTPRALAQPATNRARISQLALGFNLPLLQAFANEPRVLLVDAYTASELQAFAPAKYGLGNSTEPACTIPNSLLCTPATVKADSVSKQYWFSDDVHLTPYGYQLLARVVTDTMTRANWLAPSGSRPCNSQPDGCTLAPLPQ